MTDDFPRFKRIDSDGYAEDRPLGTVLLRRASRQIQALRQMPDQCSFVERGTSKLYAGAPRILFYHPRKIHKGLSKIRVETLLVAAPFSGGSITGGRAMMMVRIGAGRVYRSAWQDVFTASGDVAKPHQFDVEFPAAIRESWAEVAIVIQSYPYTFLGYRNFSGWPYDAQSYVYDLQPDPLAENAAVVSLDSTVTDIIRYLGPVDSPNTSATPRVRYAATPKQGSGNLSGEVALLHSISAPSGYECRTQPDDKALETHHLRANIIPRADRGPGRIMREAADLWSWPETASLGPIYDATNVPDDKNHPERYQRWVSHKNGSSSVLRYIITPRNPKIRLVLNLAIIGVMDGKTQKDSMADIAGGFEQREVSGRLTVRPGDGGVFYDDFHTIPYHAYKYDLSGHSSFLVERYISDRAADGWQWRDGQMWAGSDLDTDPANTTLGGDMQLISLVSIEAIVEKLDPTTPCLVDLSLDQAVEIDIKEIVIIGSSIQQYIPR